MTINCAIDVTHQMRSVRQMLVLDRVWVACGWMCPSLKTQIRFWLLHISTRQL